MPYKLEKDNKIYISEVPFKIGDTKATKISQKKYKQIEEEKQTSAEKEQNKLKILHELQEIDSKSIRAIRANEKAKLKELEAQAVKLREELANL